MKQRIELMRKVGVLFAFLMLVFTIGTTSKIVFAETSTQKYCENNSCTVDNANKGLEGYIHQFTDKEVEGQNLPVYIQFLLNQNPKIANQEKRQYYISTFNNAADVNVGDQGEAVAMHMYIFQILSSILWIFMLVVLFVTWVILAFYNFIFGGLLTQITDVVLQLVNGFLFQWDYSGGGIAFRLLMLVMLVLMLIGFMKLRGQNTTPKHIVGMTLHTVFLICAVATTARYSADILKPINDKTAELAASIIPDGTSNSASVDQTVLDKSLIYELTAVKPYLMRHFGVAAVSQIPTKHVKVGTNNFNTKEEDIGGVERFRRLWIGHQYSDWTEPPKIQASRVEACRGNHNSVKDCAEKLPTLVTRDDGGAFGWMALAVFISLPMTTSVQITIGILLIFMFVLELIVRLRPLQALPFMVSGLFHGESFGVIKDYFIQSFLWFVVAGLSQGLFRAGMAFYARLTEIVTGWSPLGMVFVSLAMVIFAIAALKNFKNIMGFMKDTMNALMTFAGEGLFDKNASPFESGKDFMKSVGDAYKQNLSKGGGRSKLDVDDPIKTEPEEAEKRRKNERKTMDDIPAFQFSGDKKQNNKEVDFDNMSDDKNQGIPKSKSSAFDNVSDDKNQVVPKSKSSAEEQYDFKENPSQEPKEPEEPKSLSDIPAFEGNLWKDDLQPEQKSEELFMDDIPVFEENTRQDETLNESVHVEPDKRENAKLSDMPVFESNKGDSV